MKSAATAAACLLLLLPACGRSDGPSDAAPARSAPPGDASPQPDESTSTPEEATSDEATPDEAASEEAVAGSAKAKVIDTDFVPGKLRVAVGTKVTWRQIGDQPHSVTAVDGSFDSSPKCSPLKSESCDFEGDTYSFVFDESGTFDYYCRIHGLPTGRGMTGTVVVE